MSSRESKRNCKETHKTTDRISNLPDNVTQQILECLSLKEAAKTSILSSYWRFKWASVSQLILDQSFAWSILHKGRRPRQHSDSLLVYSKVVNGILLNHDGPISKFVLCIPERFGKERDMIGHWIRYVCGKGVKEFTLGIFHNPIPTCLLSCTSLTHLTLDRCHNLALPRIFKNFPCLVSLHLSNFSNLETSLEVDQKEEIENLISKCPLLENLCIEIFNERMNLSIRAPRLQNLSLKGIVHGLSLEGTMVIKKFDLSMYLQKNKNSGKFFSCLPKLEKLILGRSFCEDIGRHKFTSPKKFPIELGLLQSLRLVGIPLFCPSSLSFVLSLVQASPNLEHLFVEVKRCKEVSGGVQIDDSCYLKCLKNVQLVNISGLSCELQLIKFLLAGSPALSEMSIELGEGMTGEKQTVFNLLEAMRHPRASPRAEIILKKKKVRMSSRSSSSSSWRSDSSSSAIWYSSSSSSSDSSSSSSESESESLSD